MLNQEDTKLQCHDVRFFNVYIHIAICCGVVIWAKFGQFESYSQTQVCSYKDVLDTKHN